MQHDDLAAELIAQGADVILPVAGPAGLGGLQAAQDNDVELLFRQPERGTTEVQKPIIDAYTSEGFDFIALRLRPNVGVRAMRPVRVTAPGADTQMPLRMVTAVVGADLLQEWELTGPVVFLPFVLMCCFVNLMLGSASAQ